MIPFVLVKLDLEVSCLRHDTNVWNQNQANVTEVLATCKASELAASQNSSPSRLVGFRDLCR